MGDETYSVEPVDDTLSGRHRVYRESDSTHEIGVCGMYSHRHHHHHVSHSISKAFVKSHVILCFRSVQQQYYMTHIEEYTNV